MNIYTFRRTSAVVILLVILAFSGCGGNNTNMSSSSMPIESRPNSSSSLNTSSSSDISATSSNSETNNTTSSNLLETSSTDTITQNELTVRFGDDGVPFTMNLYDNPTAIAIAKHVGTAAWRLPIYNYDNFDNWKVMQYYDIPNRYEIPSAPQTVTEQKAGDVYYSDPNRIVLFYGDAKINGEYTKIGYFHYTEAFVSAVEENPVLEGWGNKIINISPAE